MAETVLIDCGIWIDGNDFAGESNEVGFAPEVDTPEDTNFKSGGWREYVEGGLKTSGVTLGGFFNTLDAERFDSLGNERTVMLVPAGQSAGDVAWVVPVRVSSHGNSGSVGELLTFAYAAQGDGLPYRAQVLDIREGVTADVTAGRVQIGAVAADETFRVWVHVARHGGRVDLDLRSAGGMVGGAGTSQATLDDINATGLYELSVDGPVADEWWFLHYDITGAASDLDIAAAAAIG